MDTIRVIWKNDRGVEVISYEQPADRQLASRIIRRLVVEAKRFMFRGRKEGVAAERLLLGAVLFVGISLFSDPALMGRGTLTVYNPESQKEIQGGWNRRADIIIYNPSPVQGGVR